MFEVRVDLSGLDRLIRNAEDLEAEVTEAMAEEIKRGADAAVPVDTGALKRSGRIEDRKGGKAHAVVYGTDRVRYAARRPLRAMARGQSVPCAVPLWIESGWRRSPPTPPARSCTGG